MKNKISEKQTLLMRTVIVFVTYLVYSFVFNKIALLLSITNDIAVSFVADIFFLIFVLVLYKDKIDRDKDVYRKEGSFKKRLFKVICWIGLIAVGNILGGYLSALLMGSGDTSNNVALISLPYIYKLFKILIFGSIAEEIVVKQSIRDVIDNNLLFLIVSTLIYSVMNIAYTNVTGFAMLANAIPYAIFAIITGILYLKHKDNIYMVMVVKLLYNVIPLALIIFGGHI